MSKLSQILEDQYTQARLNAGSTIVRKLNRGLRVEMCYAINDLVLTITRDNQYPSDEEWQTIIKHLPFVAEIKVPYKTQQKARYIITSTLKLQPSNQMKFL